jgi:hypothetical protein
MKGAVTSSDTQAATQQRILPPDRRANPEPRDDRRKAAGQSMVATGERIGMSGPSRYRRS